VNLRACAHLLVTLHTGEDAAWWACRDCSTPFAPVAGSVGPQVVRGEAPAPPDEEYLAIGDLCRRIPYKIGTIRNYMTQGKLQLDVHYVKKNNGRVTFLWSAMKGWLEEDKKQGARAIGAA